MEYLKCDTVGCSHQEVLDKIHSEYINKPCPICGENLLTLQDYQAFLKVKKSYQVLIDMGFLKYASIDETNNGTSLVNINPHDGKVIITLDNI